MPTATSALPPFRALINGSMKCAACVSWRGAVTSNPGEAPLPPAPHRAAAAGSPRPAARRRTHAAARALTLRRPRPVTVRGHRRPGHAAAARAQTRRTPGGRSERRGRLVAPFGPGPLAQPAPRAPSAQCARSASRRASRGRAAGAGEGLESGPPVLARGPARAASILFWGPCTNPAPKWLCSNTTPTCRPSPAASPTPARRIAHLHMRDAGGQGQQGERVQPEARGQVGRSVKRGIGKIQAGVLLVVQCAKHPGLCMLRVCGWVRGKM